MDESDRALIDACLAGDTSRFEVLVARYQDRAYRLALHRVGSPEDAQALAIEAFTKAFQGLPRFNGRASFGTWFYRILLNGCANHLRKRFRESRYLSPMEETHLEAASGDPNPSDAALDREMNDQIRSAVNHLPDLLKDTWVLFVVDGLPIHDIAELHEVSPGAIKSRLFQARKQLQRTLQPYLEGVS